MFYWNKGQMSMYGESQFDSKLSQLLQLINPWPVELWDRCEHSKLKKHNEKNLWLQQPNGKMSLVGATLHDMNIQLLMNYYFIFFGLSSVCVLADDDPRQVPQCAAQGSC
jgi:hypothetical protein